MKMLFNNKGISLIILIIFMTLIAVLSAGFVSLISSKQKTFLFQKDSYNALNLANAGIEFSIRYVGDNINLSPNTDDFVHNPSSYFPVVSSPPDTTNLNNAAQWKKIDLPQANGSFYVSYYFDTSNLDDYTNSKILYSVGTSGNSQRIIKLKKFLSYASPSLNDLGRLNLVPNYYPYRNSRYVYIPLTNMYDGSLTITSMVFMIDSVDDNIKHLERVLFYGPSLGTPQTIYDAWDYFNTYGRLCEWGYSEPCVGRADDSIHIRDNLPTSTMDSTDRSIDGHSVRWLIFRFASSDDLRGLYTVTFNHTSGTSVIKFRIN